MKRLMILIVLLLVPLTGAGQVLCPQGTTCPAPRILRVQQEPAVVRVGCQYRKGQMEVTDWGSGTIITRRDGVAYVLTCWHIFRDGGKAGRPLVRVGRNGFWADLVRSDKEGDLALLKIKDPGVEPIEIADKEARVGESVHSAGFARVGGFHRVAGRVLTAGRVGVTVSGAIQDGDSGGPLLNRQGRLLAVCWGTDRVSRRGTHLPRVHKFLGNLFTSPVRPLVPVRPRVCPSCSFLQEQVTVLQKSVAALEAKGCVSGEMGPAGPAGKDADCQVLVLQISEIKSLASQALVAANKPLYVKKINLATGEETVEKIHIALGEGLIFKMTPHDLSQLTKREAQ